MSGEQSVYSVGIMQIRKKKASLVRRSIACSFNFSQAPRRLGLSLSARNFKVKLYTLFRTARPKTRTLSTGTSPYNPNKGVPTPPLPYSTGIFEKKRKIQICHLVLLVVVAGEGGGVFLFNRLPDPPSSERGRRETEHFQRATSLVHYRKDLIFCKRNRFWPAFVSLLESKKCSNPSLNTVKPALLSDHPKCQANVVAYGRFDCIQPRIIA